MGAAVSGAEQGGSSCLDLGEDLCGGFSGGHGIDEVNRSF